MTTLTTYAASGITGTPTYTPGKDLGFYVWFDGTNWQAWVSGAGPSYAYTITLAAAGLSVVSTNSESGDMTPQTYDNGQDTVLALSGRVDVNQDGAVVDVGEAETLIVTFSGYSFDSGTTRTKFTGQNIFLGDDTTGIRRSRFVIDLTS